MDCLRWKLWHFKYFQCCDIRDSCLKFSPLPVPRLKLLHSCSWAIIWGGMSCAGHRSVFILFVDSSIPRKFTIDQLPFQALFTTRDSDLIQDLGKPSGEDGRFSLLWFFLMLRCYTYFLTSLLNWMLYHNGNTIIMKNCFCHSPETLFSGTFL